jgi:predicted Holliday junction resolvase-like endonuclease
MRYIFWLITLLVLVTGCNERPEQRPYLVGQKPIVNSTVKRAEANAAVQIATIEAETKKEVARIEKEREVAVQQMAHDSKVQEVIATKEIELKKQETIGQQESNLQSRYNTLVILGFIFLFILLAVIAYFLYKRRQDKLKMHEDLLHKEMSIHEKELQVRMATKILDTIASGKLDKEDEKRLIESFEHSNKRLPLNK